MSVTISAAQRDALYDQILDRLSGIGDIEMAIQAERYDAAARIGREYSDDLRLLLDDLGIGDGDGEPVELSAPPEVLRRILPRLRDLAIRHLASLEPELAEVHEIEERNRRAVQACDSVLAELGASPASSQPSATEKDDDGVPLDRTSRTRFEAK